MIFSAFHPYDKLCGILYVIAYKGGEAIALVLYTEYGKIQTRRTADVIEVIPREKAANVAFLSVVGLRIYILPLVACVGIKKRIAEIYGFDLRPIGKGNGIF